MTLKYCCLNLQLSDDGNHCVFDIQTITDLTVFREDAPSAAVIQNKSPDNLTVLNCVPRGPNFIYVFLLTNPFQ